MPRTQSNTEFVWTNEAETLELEFSVSYSIEPYDKGDWYNPPSGGGPVDVSFELVGVRWIRDFTSPRQIPLKRLTARWIKRVERDMQKRYDAGRRDEERVHEAIARAERGDY